MSYENATYLRALVLRNKSTSRNASYHWHEHESSWQLRSVRFLTYSTTRCNQYTWDLRSPGNHSALQFSDNRRTPVGNTLTITQFCLIAWSLVVTVEHGNNIETFSANFTNSLHFGLPLDMYLFSFICTSLMILTCGLFQFVPCH